MPPDVERARKLRWAMSYPQVLLWQRLRGAPTGLRFRRGHRVGPAYVVELHCHTAKLAVEVEGQAHDQPAAAAYDAARDAYMRERGLRVARVAARDVLRTADAAAEAIIALASTPLHHRREGGGGPPPRRAGEDQE